MNDADALTIRDATHRMLDAIAEGPALGVSDRGQALLSTLLHEITRLQLLTFFYPERGLTDDQIVNHDRF